MKTLTRWRNKLWKAVAALFFLLALGLNGWGQVTLPHYDGLDYTDAASLQTQTGWTALNSGDNLLISAGSLSYTGLITSTGNKVTFDGSGIDAAKLFTQQTSGTIYYSFLLNVTALGTLNTTGGYFTGFTEGTGTTFGATVYTKSDGAGGYLIGLNPRTTIANAVWSTSKALNTTYLIVISYEIVSGTANDVVKLWVNPTPGSTEPTATLSATNTGTDLANVNRLFIRQDAATTTPYIQMDEIRVGTTWADVTPAPDLTAPTFTATYPSTSSITSTGFNFAVNLNEIGKAYYVVVTNGATAPTSAQVKAGNNASDVAAIKSGTINVLAATTAYTAAITGLSFATDYDVYVVAEDDETSPNVQASPTLVDVTTLAASSAKAITAFTLPGYVGTPTIDAGSRLVRIEVPATANRADLIASFTLSSGASATVGATPQVTGVTSNDFTSDVTYTITAEDGSTNDWTVHVIYHPDLVADATANNVDNDVVITFASGTTWFGAIADIFVDGSSLGVGDYTLVDGSLTLKPSNGNTLLTTAGTKTVKITATNYTDATISQVISAGAIVAGNSTASCSPALDLAATSTVTFTAKDKYNNLISGYTAKFDAIVKNINTDLNESYTIDGTNYTISELDKSLVSATNASGVATFDVTIPANVNGGDGLSVQVQLADGSTNVGSAFSYEAPLVPSLTANPGTSLTEGNIDAHEINITLLNETFVDLTIDPDNITLNNAPTGLDFVGISNITSTSLTLTLSYDGTDFDADVNNFSITIQGVELTAGGTLTSGNMDITAIVEQLPTVTTNATIDNLGVTTSRWGGDVTADGQAAVTQKGLSWGTSADPDITGSKTTEGAGIGAITGYMTGLTPSTLYHVRAYATNEVGTAYGTDYTFTTNEAILTLDALGAATYYAGDLVALTWSTEGIANVKFELYNGTSYSDLISSTPSDGTETVTIPASTAYGTAYKIKISDVLNAAKSSESAAFTVIPKLTIHEIQSNTSDGDLSTYAATKVRTKGVITAIRGSQIGFYMQDGDGDWNGIYVPYTTALNVGDSVMVVGTVTENYKFTQLNSPTVTLLNSGNTLPNISVVSTLNANNEKYESVFCKVINVTCSGAGSSSGSFIVNDGTGDLMVYKQLYSLLALNTGEKYTITGILIDYYNSSTSTHTYELLPRSATDIQSAVATVSSSVYTVATGSITNVPYSTSLATFKSNLTAATGATFEVYQLDGTTIATSMATGNIVKVTAQDGITQGSYTVTLNAALTSKDITAFSIGTNVGTITDPNIAVTVPYSTDLTSLVATFTLSSGATAKIGTNVQESGVTANNFTNPVVYIITAEDGSTKNWTITVSKQATQSSAKDILTFSVLGVDATINSTDHSLAVTLPFGTDVSALVATFTLSEAASAKVGTTTQVSGVTANNFASPVVYTITAEDASTLDWTVTISLAAASTDATISSVVYTVDNTGNTIKNVPNGTTLADFKTNLTPAANATFEVYQSDGTTVATDLATDYKVIVTAQDVTVTKVYTVTVNAPVSGADDLFFSEYVEGSSNNKAIEIFNGTGAAVDLSVYKIKLSNNGLGWGVTTTGADTRYVLPLTGTLANNDVFVLANAQAATDILAVADSTFAYNGTANGGNGDNVPTFNGNDALGLFKNDVLIDVFGLETGTADFDVAGTTGAGKDHTILRKSTITGGNTDWTASSGTTVDNSEWTVMAKDDFTNLGTHTMNGGTPDTDAPTATFVPADAASNVLVSVKPTITFNEDVFKSADGSAFTSGEDVSTLVEMYETVTPANTVAFTATITGKEITIVPTASLSNDIQYTVGLKAASVEDAAGNENIAASTSFTTISATASIISTVAISTAAPYYAGDAITLTWSSANVTNAKIEIYVPSTTSYTELLASTVSDGTESVTLPAALAYSANYKIRVSDAANANVNAESAIFTVIPDLTIHEIQSNNTAGASNYTSTLARIKGVITAVNSKNFYLQDGSGAWNGVYVYYNTTHTYLVGDNVTIVGKIDEYNGLTEITTLSSVVVNSTGNAVIPSDVTAIDVTTESFEGCFVKVVDAVCMSGASGTFVLNDGTGDFTVYKGLYSALNLTVGNTYSISGVMTWYNGGSIYELLPRSETDIQAAASTDATLSDLTIDETTIDGFDSEVYSYNVLLSYGTTTIPVVAAVTTDANATAAVTQATQLPGDANVVVTAEDGETELTYTVHFTVALNDVATLADLKVDGTTIEGFDVSILVYNVILPVGTTEIPVVTATTTDENAELFITEATSVPGITKVKVIAENGTDSLIYEVRFTFEGLSNDASLADLKVDGTTIEGFSADVNNYTIELPFGTETIPTITATANEANAEVEITQASALPGTASILVSAQDGVTTNIYEVKFTIAPSNVATLSNIMIDGDDLVGFDPTQLVYVIVLPAGTTVAPSVYAEATDIDATITITDATTLPGTTIIKVVAENGIDSLKYELRFTLEGLSSDASLSDLKVDGTTIDGFATGTYEYTVILPYGTGTIPVVMATATNANAVVVVNQATAIPGDASVVVTAQDEATELTYLVHFVIAANDDATLSDLTINGNTVTGFVANIFTYNIELPVGTTAIPVVGATAADVKAEMTISQATELPGSANVVVIAEDGTTTLTYTVNFTVKQVQFYTVSFTVKDQNNNAVEGATVEFNDISLTTSINGSVIFEQVSPVTQAPYSVSKADYTTYQGTVTVADANVTVDVVLQYVGIVNEKAWLISVFPNPAKDVLNISLSKVTNNCQIIVTNLEGEVMKTESLNDIQNHLDISDLSKGIYIITIKSEAGNSIQKIVIE